MQRRRSAHLVVEDNGEVGLVGAHGGPGDGVGAAGGPTAAVRRLGDLEGGSGGGEGKKAGEGEHDV